MVVLERRRPVFCESGLPKLDTVVYCRVVNVLGPICIEKILLEIDGKRLTTADLEADDRCVSAFALAKSLSVTDCILGQG